MFYLVVSIYENTSFRRFLPFLTAGNKSKYGTLHRLTHPQQSTDEPIFRPVSPRKRQAIQGKPLILSPISTQTSSHLRTHGTSVPSTPQKLPGAPQPHPDAPPDTPRRSPRHTPDARPDTPRDAPLPTPKSHVIPPGPHSSTAQKPRNINNLISKPETPSGELRAKLLSCTTVPGTPRPGPTRGLWGLAAVPEGGGRARAGLEIDHSERSSRVAISRAGHRPPAHTAARPNKAGHAAAGDLVGQQQRRKSGGPQQAAPRAAAAQ